MINRFNHIVKKASKGLENTAAIILFVAAMLIIVNVITRRAFNAPIHGVMDIILFCTTMFIGLSLAYCAVRDGHIYISILTDRFPKSVRKVIDIVIGTISAVFLLMVTWQLILYGNNMRLTGEVSLTIRFPHYPFIYIQALGFGMLTLVVIGKVLELFANKEGDEN